MKKLVIDHSYAHGLAWDKTPFRNHGVVHQASPGIGSFSESLSFAKGRTAPGSLVVVPPSDSLRRIGTVRTKALVFVNRGGTPRRHNIIEGHLSFAVAVYPDWSVHASFLAPDGTWIGVKTAPDTFKTGKWTWVEFWYDGAGHAEILLDGESAASSYNTASLSIRPLKGPVPGIGPLGVCIGHWAALNDIYTLGGYIKRVQVYKDDPDNDELKLVDPCCIPNTKDLDKLIAKLVEGGYTPDKGLAAFDKIASLGNDFIAEMTSGSEEKATQLNELLGQLIYAVQNRRSGVPIGPAINRGIAWVMDNATPAQIQAVRAKVPDVKNSLPFDEKQIDELLKRLCLGGVKDAIVDDIKKLVVDDVWKKRADKFKPR